MTTERPEDNTTPKKSFSLRRALRPSLMAHAQCLKRIAREKDNVTLPFLES